MFRITVLMGIFNCATTLDEALQSLYAQTYQDFKIILCEDGSTDDTYQVAQRHAASHDNVILIRNERNMGLNYTLNRCLELADTEYVARMDGDDTCTPDRFEKEINFLDAHPEYAIVSGGMSYFDEGGEFARSLPVNQGGEVEKSDFNHGTPFWHAPSMTRTAAYRAVGGYTEDERLLRVEDYNLWTKMYAAGFKGYNLTDVIYAMRDDRNATKRRTLRNGMKGIYAHYLAYRTLHLSLWYLIKDFLLTVIKCSLPRTVYTYFHKKKLQK